LCTGFKAYNQARNSDFQPQVADISKLAGLYLAHSQYVEGVDERLHGTRTFNMVHDEHNVEAPESQYEAAAVAMSDCFTRAAKVICPDVPFRSSTAAMSRLRKCDPKYGDDGRLLII
jgi:DNA polymerase I-like protein with 3'-5' exonuclease and polymerase domains